MGKKNRRRETKKALLPLPSVETNGDSDNNADSIDSGFPGDWRSATNIATLREANVTSMFESQLKHCRSSPPLEQVMHMLELSKKVEKAAFEVAPVKELYEMTVKLRTILPPVPPSLALPLSETDFIKWFDTIPRLLRCRVS